MTHGLADFDFSYSDEDVTEKVKEAIEAWKNVHYVKQGSSAGTTLGYPLWQASRGKGFVAPKIEGPNLPIHTFNEPFDYVAEAEGRYEYMYQQWKEKESKDKEGWECKLRMAEEEIQDEKRRSFWIEQQTQRWKNKFSNLDASLVEKNMQIDSLNQKNEAMRSELNYLKTKLEDNSKVIFLLQEEKTSMDADRSYWSNRSNHFEGQHQDLLHKTCELLNDIQELARKAHKRAREAEEAEEEAPPGKVREFLSVIKRELEYFGNFH
ncbi:MAG: hypothetical protein Q8736_02455 [Sweet potato little leaf phytoplasma]|nr:hypothetical protein [Sweet potato little leaf phytoplasma]